MTTPTIDTVKHPDGVHRDRYTRPIYPVPNDDGVTKCKACGVQVPGRPYTRMTKFIGVLDDKYQLQKYLRRQVLIGVVLKDYLVLRASNAMNTHRTDNQAMKAALDDIADDAAEAAGSHDAASRGTELHNTLEAIMRGDDVDVPAAFRPDVKALQDVLAIHRLNAAPDDLEVNIVIDAVRPQKSTWGIGGRFDLILTIPEPCDQCGRNRRVGDYKTGQVWYHGCYRDNRCGQESPADCPRRTMYGADEFRMQLAGYASGRRIDTATGERFDLNVCQCWGYIIHLPAGEGRCELLTVDLERGRNGLRQALAVWQWRDGNRPLAATPPPVDVETSSVDVTAMISVAANRANLLGLRAHYIATGHWTAAHDEAAKRRLAELEAVPDGRP